MTAPYEVDGPKRRAPIGPSEAGRNLTRKTAFFLLFEGPSWPSFDGPAPNREIFPLGGSEMKLFRRKVHPKLQGRA